MFLGHAWEQTKLSTLMSLIELATLVYKIESCHGLKIVSWVILRTLYFSMLEFCEYAGTDERSFHKIYVFIIVMLSIYCFLVLFLFDCIEASILHVLRGQDTASRQVIMLQYIYRY